MDWTLNSPSSRIPTEATDAVSRLGDPPTEAHFSLKMDDHMADGEPAAPAPGGVTAGQASQDSAPYQSRDAAAKVEEDSGALQFRVVRNDGQRHNMIWLMQVKNLIRDSATEKVKLVARLATLCASAPA